MGVDEGDDVEACDVRGVQERLALPHAHEGRDHDHAVLEGTAELRLADLVCVVEHACLRPRRARKGRRRHDRTRCRCGRGGGVENGERETEMCEGCAWKALRRTASDKFWLEQV